MHLTLPTDAIASTPYLQSIPLHQQNPLLPTSTQSSQNLPASPAGVVQCINDAWCSTGARRESLLCPCQGYWSDGNIMSSDGFGRLRVGRKGWRRKEIRVIRSTSDDGQEVCNRWCATVGARATTASFIRRVTFERGRVGCQSAGHHGEHGTVGQHSRHGVRSNIIKPMFGEIECMPDAPQLPWKRKTEDC